MQILPAIQPLVEHVTFFMRSPTWLLPPISDIQHVYTDDELARLKDPQISLAIRNRNEIILNAYFNHYFQGSAEQNEALAQYNKRLRTFLPDHLPKDKLFPISGTDCHRLTAGAGYLESLSASNVTTVFNSVASFTRSGCVDSSGTEYKDLDAIICATGFNTSYIPRFPILGLDNVNMQSPGLHNHARILALLLMASLISSCC